MGCAPRQVYSLCSHATEARLLICDGVTLVELRVVDESLCTDMATWLWKASDRGSGNGLI